MNIYIKLMGGLGNQMFQFAAGRYLAIKNRAKLQADLSFLRKKSGGNYTQRDYALDVFAGAPAQTGKLQQKILNLTTTHPRLTRLNPFFPNVFKEAGMHYDSGFERINKSTLLVGYWQSEKYFAPIRSVLIEDFQLKAPLGIRAQDYLKKIHMHTSTASLHFRRGDYVTLQSAAAAHGTQNLDYYHAAVKRILALNKDTYFFIFSDDPDWVSQNFILDNSTIVRGLPPVEDLILMKQCKHNIIANSSFSWWGAWLNENPGKKVLAPARWFAAPHEQPVDLIPKDWETID